MYLFYMLERTFLPKTKNHEMISATTTVTTLNIALKVLASTVRPEKKDIHVRIR